MEENLYISSLLKEKDGEQLEIHATFDESSIYSTVCGFLNTKGGRLLIGIDNANKPHINKDIDAHLERIQVELFKQIKPSSIVSIRKEPFKNSEIILIEVIEGNKKPYSFENKAFIRLKSNTQVADDNQMGVLIRDRKDFEYSWERSLCMDAEVNDLYNEEIKQIIKFANLVKRSIDFEPNDTNYFLDFNQLSFNQGVTNGALVLFGKKPTYFLPQCTVRIVEFPDGKTGKEFSDTQLIENNLFGAFREVQSYFKRTIPLVSKFDESEWQRNDEHKYPLQSLDEAVINAMMHRDYSDRGGEVFIGIYKDKIEISNSGELPHFLNNAKLKKSHQSVPPNPSITHMVFLAGMIEKVGRGTILITEQFKKLGHPAPKWKSKNGFTKLTLFGSPKKVELNDRMQYFLNTYEKDKFNREDYSSFFENEISERTAGSDLSKLVDGGYLERSGKGPNTTYVRIQKLPDVAR